MSVIDRTRFLSTGRSPSASGTGPDRVPAWWTPLVAGAVPPAATWLLLALPALVLWVVTAHTSVGWGQALGVASAVWFLGQGGPIDVDGVPVSVTPLGLWLLALLLTARALARLLDRTERAAAGTTWPTLLVRRVLPGFGAGYAGVAVLAWLLALAGPARPNPFGVLIALTVPTLAAAWCLLRRYTQDREAGPVGEWLDRAPLWMARALVPGIAGAGLLVGLGAALLVVMVVARFSTVTGLTAAVGAGVVGGALLLVGQLLLAPNLAVWGVAWLSGPGFQVADGTPTTLGGAEPGLLPLIPVLGALPSEGSWSRWLLLLLAAPALVGGVIAWLACRSTARLASWRTKLATAAVAVAVSAVGLVLLSWVGGGSAGVDRLRHIGSNPLLVGLALLGELLLGAAAYVLGAQLRLRLRH